jgi:hypothetical protein
MKIPVYIEKSIVYSIVRIHWYTLLGAHHMAICLQRIPDMFNFKFYFNFSVLSVFSVLNDFFLFCDVWLYGVYVYVCSNEL